MPMTTLIRIANWTPRTIDPRKSLSGLALKLLALGALKDPRDGARLAEDREVAS